MATNIEKLTSRVEETKNQIEKSKQLSSVEKIQKAKELEETISKIKSDLDLLRVSATPEELKELDKLEAKYENVENKFQLEFKTELTSLENEVKKIKDNSENNIDNKEKDNFSAKEEEKGRIKTQRDKIPEGGKKALKIAGGVVGGVLVWRGIKKLFNWGKNKNNGEKKEGFWGHGIGKGLKYAGIAVAGVFGGKWIYKNRDKVKSWFDFESKGGKLEKQKLFLKYWDGNKEIFRKGLTYNEEKKIFNYRTEQKSFNDLVSFDSDGALNTTETEKNIKNWTQEVDEQMMNHTSLKEADEILKDNPKLNHLGDNVNKFHNIVGLSAMELGDANYDKGKPGLILAQLSNMKDNVGDLLAKGSYEAFLEQTETGYLDMIMEWATSLSTQAGASALTWIASLVPNVSVPRSSKSITEASKEQLLSWAKKLQEENKDAFEENAQSIFLKRMNSITYLQSVKNRYMYNLIKDKLSNKEFDALSKEEQDDLIWEKLEEDSFIKANIEKELEEFDKLSILDIANTSNKMLLSAVENPMINHNIIDSIDDIDESENDLLNDLDEAESDEEIREVADKLIDDINSVGYNTRYAGMQTRWNSVFQTDAEKMHDMADGQYDELMKGTLEKINNIKNKTKLTKTDKAELQELINGYSKTKKSMILAGQYKTDTTDEGFITRYMLPIREGGKKKYYYLSATGNMGVLEWGGFVADGVLLAGTGYLTADILTRPLRKLRQVFRLGGGFKVSGPTDWLIRKSIGKTGNLLSRGTFSQLSRFKYYNDISRLKYYNTFGDRFLGVIKHDFIKGKISIQDVDAILRRKGLITGASKNYPEVFQKMFEFENRDDAKRLLKIYNKDKNLFIKLIDKSTKIKDIRKFKYVVDMERLKFIESIGKDKFGLKIFSQLKSQKDFTKFSKLYPNLNKLNLTKHSGYIDDIARAIAKNINKIDNIGDIDKILEHIATNGKMVDKGAFFSNAMKNLESVKKPNFKFGAENVKKLKLNEVTQKIKIKRLQSSLTGAEDAVKKVMKTAPKTKIPGLKLQLKQLSIIKNARFESLKALEFGFGDSNVLRSLYAKPGVLSQLNKLNPSVIKKIANLESVSEIRKLLKNNNIEGVSEDVLKNLSKMKKIDSITNLFSYAKNYPKYQAGFGKVLGVLKSPGMKYVSKMFGRAIGGLAIGLSVYHGIETYGEGSDLILSGQNIQRGKMKQEAGVAMGAVGAIAGALMFVPGVGRVLGAVVGASEILVDTYYETVDKYLQNFNDLITKTDLYVKETIISIISGIRNNDRSFGDSFSRFVQYVKKNSIYYSPVSPVGALALMLIDEIDFDKQGDKLLQAAMKALIHLDELKKHPYASIDYKDEKLSIELKKAGITETVIASELGKVRSSRDARVDYFQGNYKSVDSIISNSELEGGKGISKLTQVIDHTNMFLQIKDVSTKEDLDNHMKHIENKLGQYPYKLFESLTDKQLLYYYHHRESLIDNNDIIISNKKLFEEYMQYKSFKGELDLFDTANIGLYNIDHTELINFFTEFSIRPKVFLSQEVENAYTDMTMSYTETCSMFNVSSNPIQNSLYRVIKEVIGYPAISNNQTAIQSYLSEDNNSFAETHYGLYFDDNQLSINGERVDDNFDRDEDISGVISEIDDNFIDSEDAIDQGSGDTYLNKELGRKYLDIFKQEQEIFNNKQKYTNKIVDHIKQYSKDGGYIRLPLNDIELGIKIGIKDIARNLYKVENGKIVTYKTGGYLSGM